MALRFKTLIVLCIVVYVALSLYHWRLVKNIPGPDSKKIVPSVLTKNNQKKTWVQVSTSPENSLQKTTDKASSQADRKEVDAEEDPAVLASGTDQVQKHLIEDSIVPTQEKREIEEKREPPPQASVNEEGSDHGQSQELAGLRSQITALSAELDETSFRLQKKNQQLEQLKNQLSEQTYAQSVRPDSEAQIRLLKASLTTKMDALERANKRITGLAELLDQSRESQAETQNAFEHLQDVLSDTEHAKIRAEENADRLDIKLSKAQLEKERYLADTGSLHEQLRQTKNRLAYYENKLKQAQLKSEAMLRYGQEQTELITPFRQQIEILNARLADLNSELLSAEEQVIELQEQKLTLQKNMEKLQLEEHKNRTLGQELKKTAELLQEEQVRTVELTVQLKGITEQLNEKDAETSDLHQHLTEKDQALQVALQQSDDRQKTIVEQQKELLMLKEQLSLATNKAQEIETKLTETQTKLAETETSNHEIIKTIEQLEVQLAAAKVESDKLTAQLTDQTTLHAEKDAARQKLQTEPDQLTLNSEEGVAAEGIFSDQEMSNLQTALEAAEANLVHADQEIQHLQASLTEAQQEKEAIASQLKEQIEGLNKVIVDTKSRHDNMLLKMQGVEQQNSQLQENIAAAEEKNMKIAEISTVLEDKTHELEKVTATLENKNRELEELSATLENKNRELDDTRQTLTTQKNKAIDLRAELENRETAFFTMQEELNTLQESYDAVIKERDALRLYTIDSDSDSVPDAIDACPETEQGVDVTREGCEPDKDGDTVVDRLDLCPESPALADLNILGCAKGKNILLTGIYFSGGNAELSPSAQSYLQKVVAALQKIKDRHFEVSGHTDSIGEPQRNLTVSQKRAEAVRDFLVENGIDASRLVATGYGSEHPIGDNATVEGRAVNRRVELRILPPPGHSSQAEETELSEAAEREGLPTQ